MRIQESQVIFAVNIPALLTMGFIVAMLLPVIGYREKQLPARANTLFRAGLVLLGLMAALMPIVWYYYGAVVSGTLTMSISDIFILGFGTMLGGIVMGVGLPFRLRTG